MKFIPKNRPPFLTILLISALTLAYEVLLTRLLSIIQWHHFAYMIISIALLGYGASGAFITIAQEKLTRNFSLAFFSNIILFAISGITDFLLLQRLPFNPLELFWDKSQWVWLFAIYILLMLPFFFAANCIGLVFSHYRERIGESYAADLLGASLGAIGIVVLLNWLFPEVALQVIVSSAGLIALLAVFELGLKKSTSIIGLMLIVAPWLLPQNLLDLKSSEFKSLNQTLNISGAHVRQQISGPMAVLTVVESPTIPFRYAPGLSLNSSSIPAEQLGVFFDSDNMSVITRFDGNAQAHAYLDNMTTSLPYQLIKNPEVLILGAGGGGDVLQAIYYQAKNIDAVELNQQMADLVRREYADYSGNIFSLENVKLHVAEARSYIQTTDKQYDIIQMALMDSFAASAAGLYALNESYLYTQEAMALYLSRLKSDGILSLTRWIKLPPRDTLKLVATAKLALRNIGIAHPEQHIALIRSWNTATLIIKKSPFSPTDIQNIKEFSHKKMFDLAYYPGISETNTNQYNILPDEYFYQGSIALLSEKSDEFIDQFKYNLQPATDDKPYFFHFLKWQSLSEILQLPANQGLVLIEWGTIILISTLLQAIVASAVLILLPLWIYQRRQHVNSKVKISGFVFNYFLLLGIAFMFIEMAFIQKLILFLSHPVYSLAVVLTGFLFFAGIGSAVSKQWSATLTIKFAIFGIILIPLLYLWLLPVLFNWCLDFPAFVKIIISLILIAPLAFLMGMPFPKGLTYLAQKSPGHIPWAWGVNGCASVISAITATLLAMQLGFSVVIFIALLCYSLAGFIFLRKLSEAN